MMKRRILLVAAILIGFEGISQGQLLVDETLGTLGAGTVNVTGDTATASSEVDVFGELNAGLQWGNEIVFEFMTTEPLSFNLTLNSQSGCADLFLLSGLGTVEIDGQLFAEDLDGIFFLDGALPLAGTPVTIPPGTHYVCVATFQGAAPGDGMETTFDFDIMLDEVSAPAGVWDEAIVGLSDAGDFPVGEFQAATDDSETFTTIVGNNIDGIDSYLICVTDAANFFITEDSGADTLAFVWDTEGNPIFRNDDNPLAGLGFGFGDAFTHPGSINGTTTNVSNGDLLVLSIGAFGNTAVSDGFSQQTFIPDGGDFAGLFGPSGENFIGYSTNLEGPGGYLVTLGGAKVGVDGGDVLLGDVNLDGEVDLFDVSPFVALITTGVFQAEADINEDGDVDLFDVSPFVTLLTNGG